MNKQLKAMVKKENELYNELKSLETRIYELKNEYIVGQAQFSYRKQAKIEKLEQQYKRINCELEDFQDNKTNLLASEKFKEFKKNVYEENLKKLQQITSIQEFVNEKYLEILEYKQKLDIDIRNIQDDIEINNNELMRFCGKKDKYIIYTEQLVRKSLIEDYTNWLYEKNREDNKKSMKLKIIPVKEPELSLTESFNMKISKYVQLSSDNDLRLFFNKEGPINFMI